MAAEIRPPGVAAVKAKANVNEYENAHVHEIHASIVSESLEFLENEQTKNNTTTTTKNATQNKTKLKQERKQRRGK